MKKHFSRVAAIFGAIALAAGLTACGNIEDNKYWNAEPEEHYRPQ